MLHMRDEIHQQPHILENLISAELRSVQRMSSDIRKLDVRFLVLAARGSSDNSARYGKYLFGSMMGLQVGLATPSLFTIYDSPPKLKDALVVGISQSGRSQDIISVLAEARHQGVPTLAITNDSYSPLADHADYLIELHAGEEMAIPATKTYTAQVASLALLTACWLGDKSRLEELRRTPKAVARTLELEPQIESEVVRYMDSTHGIIVGRGYNYCTAFEIALKMKETSYLAMEPYSPADYLHGPIALMEPGDPAIIVAPSGKAFANLLEFSRELQSRGASQLTVSDEPSALKMADVPLRLPVPLPEWLSPLSTIIPGQLLAMHLSLARGHNPDQPRGLKKVTSTY